MVFKKVFKPIERRTSDHHTIASHPCGCPSKGLDKQDGPSRRLNSDQGLDRITNETGDTIMSITMSDTATTTEQNNPVVREFMGNKVNFIANDDLRLHLRKGGNKNIGSEWHPGEARVLVTTNVDECGYSNVEVEDASLPRTTYADTIEAAIEALIVVRDALRKMATAA